MLAGIGLIHVLRLLADTLREGPIDDWHDTAREWFDASRTDGPILSLFHLIKVEKSEWIRVPPGLLHAWQGGGNLVVETSNRSDQTYRLFDYGRELSRDTRRPMHYKEAMYALNPEAFLKPGAHRRLAEGSFHRDIELKMLKSADAGVQGLPIPQPPENNGWAFAMNIDSPMELTAIADATTAEDPARGQHPSARSQSDGPQAEHLFVPPLSTVLFQTRATLYVTPQERNDRVLLLYPRQPEDFKTTLLISLGATKIEIALKSEGATPPTRHQAATPENIANELKTASNNLKGVVF